MREILQLFAMALFNTTIAGFLDLNGWTAAVWLVYCLWSGWWAAYRL